MKQIKSKVFSTRYEGRRSYHRSRVKLRDDMMQESCEVGGPRLELLNAVKAVTLAICLKNNQRNSLQSCVIFPTKLGL